MKSSNKSSNSATPGDEPFHFCDLKPGDVVVLGGAGVPGGECRLQVARVIDRGTVEGFPVNEHGIRMMAPRMAVSRSNVYIMEVNGESVFEVQ